MRDIKFRGLTFDREWLYGDLVSQTCNAYSKIVDVGIKEFQMHVVEVRKNTVGQFTGLTDKNDKDIYENDIIKFNIKLVSMKFVGKVIFDDSSWCGIVKNMKETLPFGALNDFEIIGNIHDNPELL